MCRYSDKFSSSFPKFDLFFVLWTFNYNKIVLQLKSLRTADVVYTSKNINSLHYNIYCVSKTKWNSWELFSFRHPYWPKIVLFKKIAEGASTYSCRSFPFHFRFTSCSFPVHLAHRWSYEVFYYSIFQKNINFAKFANIRTEMSQWL